MEPVSILIIENDSYPPDHFLEFLYKLRLDKGLPTVYQVYHAIKQPEIVMGALKKGAQCIAISPHVVDGRQWEPLLDFMVKHPVPDLKEIYVYYNMDDLSVFEKELRRALSKEAIQNIRKITESGVMIFISRLKYKEKSIEKELSFREIDLEKLEAKILL